MLRMVLFFIKLFVVAGVALWIAQIPGTVSIEWYGWRLHTSMGVCLGGVLLITVLCTVMYLWGQFFLNLPGRVLKANVLRKYKKGYRCLVEGMNVYYGEEDDKVFDASRKIQNLFPSPLVGMWLEAQQYLKQHQTEAAQKIFLKIQTEKEGDFLGLYGLTRLALQEKDMKK